MLVPGEVLKCGCTVKAPKKKSDPVEAPCGCPEKLFVFQLTDTGKYYLKCNVCGVNLCANSDCNNGNWSFPKSGQRCKLHYGKEVP